MRYVRAALHACPHRLAASAHAGDVEESHRGIHACQRVGPPHREVVREVRVFGFAHAHGGHAEAEEAGVVAVQLTRIHVEVEHVCVDKITQLRMRDAGRIAAD